MFDKYTTNFIINSKKLNKILRHTSKKCGITNFAQVKIHKLYKRTGLSEKSITKFSLQQAIIAKISFF